MLTGNDLRKLALYLHNVEILDFARDVYERDKLDYYVEEKFEMMQKKPMAWIGTLDSVRLDNLVKAVNNK